MKTLAAALFPLFSFSFLAIAATPSEIDALIVAARATPGEFGADALLRIAALEPLDRNRRVELLEQAFERASGAQEPYKRVAALLRLPGPVGLVNKAYAQELDGLSLRLRSVEAMLPLDAKKARGLFGQIPALKLTRATCSDFLVYDVARYYDVLEKVVGVADASEKAALLERAAAAVSSPVQLGAMARALTFADVPDETFGRLLETFGRAMGSVSGDDRSFTYARRVGMQIEALTTECKRRKLSPLQMLEGYRVYLVFNLSAARCADDLQQAGALQAFVTVDTEPNASDLAGHFNQKLQTAPLQPIQELESTPSRFEGVAAGPRVCQDPQCLERAELFRGLVFGPDQVPIPPAQRSTPQWQEKLREVLASLRAWKASANLTPIELYRERSAAYNNLLSLVPPGAGRNALMRALLEFVTPNPVQKTNRIEWFLPVNGLIARTALEPAAYGPFLEQLRKSADPVIALYAALEAAAPRSAHQVLPLL